MENKVYHVYQLSKAVLISNRFSKKTLYTELFKNIKK